MKTYDYIIKKCGITVGNQYIIDIPNMGRDNLAELFAELNLTKGVELGVDRGEFSEVLCKANPQARIYSIDPWASFAYAPNTYVNEEQEYWVDRKSTRLNSSHGYISYAVFCLKKKKKKMNGSIRSALAAKGARVPQQ